MKRLIWILLLPFLALVACQRPQTIQNPHVDFVILQGKRLVTFKEGEGPGIFAVKTEELQLPNEIASYIEERNLVETADAYYATASFNKGQDYLIKIDRKDFRITTKPLSFQSMGIAVNGSSIYLADMMGGIYRFDKQLQQVQDNQLFPGGSHLGIYALEFVGKDLYALGVRGEYSEDHTYKGESVLFRLKEDLSIEEQFILPEEGATMNMVAADSDLYITVTSSGKLPNGEPAPAYHLLRHNTLTGEQEIIDLHYAKPVEIGYNAKQKELYIHQEMAHDQPADLYYTYPLNGQEMRIIVAESNGQGLKGFLQLKNGDYYYATATSLTITSQQNTSKTVSLEKLKLDPQEPIVLLKK